MESDDRVREWLRKARETLLDLTTRNRLINTNRSAKRSSRLEIVDERSEQVFQMLVRAKKPMSFLAVKEPDTANGEVEAGALKQPEGDELSTTGVAPNHTDDRLQTRLPSKALQTRLLKQYLEARTFQEEQGVNVLYLALGFLEWYEDDKSDVARQGPLLLIPVSLERKSAGSRFQIRYNEDEISTNLSLQRRLRDLGVVLPDVPDIEDISPTKYFDAVSQAIAEKPNWKVFPNDMVLWFFSFSKFLMYRDLDPETWPDCRLDNHPLIAGLAMNSVRGNPPLFGENDNIDDILQPTDMLHVLDADSSQTVAIEEVRQRRHLVIQGPPGTGKSQTIANLIAAAIKDRRTVLFVAEKMAALEVVKRRLDSIGLGETYLELHSNKAKRDVVLLSIKRTWQNTCACLTDTTAHAAELKEHRDRLNRYVRALHAPIQPSGFTLYHVMGNCASLRASGISAPAFALDAPTLWTEKQFRERRVLVANLETALQEIAEPQSHPWRGVELAVALPGDIERWITTLREIIPHLAQLIESTRQLADLLKVSCGVTATESAGLARFAQRVLNAPPMDRKGLGSAVWTDCRERIDSLLYAGSVLSESRTQLAGVVAEMGWSANVVSARHSLAAHGRSWLRWLQRSYRDGQACLRGILVGTPPKPLTERVRILDTLIAGQGGTRTIDDPENQQLGREAFGRFWRGTDSDWPALAAIAKWETETRASDDAPAAFRQVVAGIDDTGARAN